MMRIAVLGTRGFPNVQGGVEAHCENLYPQLVKKGCEVAVFTRKPYVDLSMDSYKGVKLIPLSCPRNKYLEALFHTFVGVFAAKRIHPDILHIHAIGPSLCIPLARFLGINVVMTNHGPDYQRAKWGKFPQFVLKLGERLGSKWSHGIICVSKPIADAVKTKYHKDVNVIPNGVNIQEISTTEDILEQYGLAKGRYILSVGRLVPEKGFYTLIDAFTVLQLHNWKLVIVGRADHKDRYSVELQKKGSKNRNVILTGFLSGKPLHELYSHAGLFVLPSYYEGLPIVLLEAMSYGLSCIASGIPAHRDVELGEDRFFEPGDVEGLAKKIREFVHMPLGSEERSKQVRLIAQRYDWDQIAEKTLEVYKKVAAFI